MKKIIATLIFLLAAGLTVADEQPTASPLFAATLNDLDDRPVALARYKGKPLIVNFWARWCAPCRAEIPDLIALRQAHQGKLEVLGIGIEDQTSAVREFAKSYKINYPVFVAKEKGIPLMQALANRQGGLPYTVIIDRHGQVIQTRLGPLKKAELDAIAEKLLK